MALAAARLSGLAAALFDPYALRSQLLGSTVVPCYRRADADEEVGRLFYWEQRLFLAHIGVADGVAWRKHEKRRNILGQIREQFELGEDGIIIPADCNQQERGFQTPVFSSAALLAWLVRTFRASFETRLHGRAQRVYGVINRYVDIAAQGFDDQPGECQIDLDDDVVLQLTPDTGFLLDISPLLHEWDSFHDDWEAVRKKPPFHLLAPVCRNRVALSDAILFCDLCIECSVPEPTPTLIAFRRGLMGVIVPYFEVGAFSCLVDPSEASAFITDLFGVSNRRRQRRSVCGKFA